MNKTTKKKIAAALAAVSIAVSISACGQSEKPADPDSTSASDPLAAAREAASSKLDEIEARTAGETSSEAEGAAVMTEVSEETDEYVGSESDDTFTYDVYEKHAEIKEYSGSGREATVPDEFKGVPVTKIGAGVFKDQKSLTNVNIGANVKIIDKNAFENCKLLLEVSFSAPEKLETIGSNAFAKCELIKEMPYFKSLTEMNYRAFSETAITEFTVPSGVTEINGFSETEKLKKVIIENGAASVADYAFRSSSIEEIDIPDSVESIGEEAFSRCESLKEVVIGSGVKRIEKSAFSGCRKIESLNLSEGLEYIGEGAFSNMDIINELNIPSSVNEIGKQAFFACAFKKVTLNSGIETIGMRAFQKCEKLEEINLPDTLVEIGYDAFEECYALKELTIPGSIVEVPQIYSYCESLTKLTVSEGVISLTGLHSDYSKFLELKEVYLPDSLAKISGFDGCPNVVYTYKGKQYTADQRDELFSLING